MSRRLLIVGAGALGREILAWSLDIERTQSDWHVAGFLDGNSHALDGFETGYEVLDDISSYQPSDDDLLTVAIGNPAAKLNVCRDLESRGARFATLIHPTCVIGPGNTIGAGTVICPFSTVTTNVNIGRFVLMNTYACVGHDCVIGDGCTINGHCAINGCSQLAEGAFLGGHAVINPSAKVGAFARVGAGSTVLQRVRPHTTVLGVPAKKIWQDSPQVDSQSETVSETDKAA